MDDNLIEGFVKEYFKEVKEKYEGFTLKEMLADLKKQKVEQNEEITKEEKKELEKAFMKELLKTKK